MLQMNCHLDNQLMQASKVHTHELQSWCHICCSCAAWASAAHLHTILNLTLMSLHYCVTMLRKMQSLCEYELNKQDLLFLWLSKQSVMWGLQASLLPQEVNSPGCLMARVGSPWAGVRHLLPRSQCSCVHFCKLTGLPLESPISSNDETCNLAVPRHISIIP